MVVLDYQEGDVIRVKTSEGDIVITLDISDPTQATFFITAPDSARMYPGELADKQSDWSERSAQKNDLDNVMKFPLSRE